MCLAVPGKVIEMKGKTCVAEILGVTREASIELLKDVKVGDFILIHAGCAIQVIDEEEAENTLELFNELRELSHE